jgi:mannose-6-phosphate isomerase-like protein (cupin superfamily)
MAITDRYNPAAEFHTVEGCYITELRNSDEDAACSIARARITPGTTTRLHSLEHTAERYVIIRGSGAVTVGTTAAIPVQAFDVVHIPAGIPQQISNTGSGDLVFLCICTPRFRMENYRDLEA